MLQASPRIKVTPRLTHVLLRPAKGLERLPAELLDLICDHLPVQSIISLHRTSRSLYNLTPLDNIFWRDSLRKGRLYPHIGNLDTRWIEKHLNTINSESFDPTFHLDWTRIARFLATKRFAVNQRNERFYDIPNEYWNRCRIWSTVEEALIADADMIFKKKESSKS